MTDYTKLVEALRCKRDDCEGCDLSFFDKDEGWMCQYAAKDDDAAAAIEALQAKVTRLQKEVEFSESSYDELSMQAAIQNALLAQQLPKLGEWIDDEFTCKGRCSVCGEEWSWFDNCMETFKFCPNCGAKMEVQDDD